MQHHDVAFRIVSQRADTAASRSSTAKRTPLLGWNGIVASLPVQSPNVDPSGIVGAIDAGHAKRPLRRHQDLREKDACSRERYSLA
jgi:hypothetical protein